MPRPRVLQISHMQLIAKSHGTMHEAQAVPQAVPQAVARKPRPATYRFSMLPICLSSMLMRPFGSLTNST